jgi:hypothetical protein
VDLDVVRVPNHCSATTSKEGGDEDERTLMSPKGVVNRRDDQIKLFLPQTLELTVLHRSDRSGTGLHRCSTEHLQKQLQAPLDF